MSDAPMSLTEIQAWFEGRGLRLEFREEAGRHWLIS
jgi:hypothetical protein